MLVDLSRMNKIRSFNAELGLMALEPGVTQRTLRDWLDAHGLDFMVPTTGAGPGCSIIGNALERGYGITPLADHFGAVTALEAVLADGSVYRSPMAEQGGFDGFRWGVGPYLDGIFSQGNAGIVTGMTVALARRPERVEAFYFWLDHDSRLEAAVDATRCLLQDAGANLGGVNLLSAARVQAMSAQRAVGTPPPSAGSAAWIGMGAIYGTHRHAAATRALIRRGLRGIALRVVFMTSARAQRLNAWFRWIPGARARQFGDTLTAIQQSLALLEGVPSEVALPLAYQQTSAPPQRDLHPSRDGCGLLWYAPIVPLSGADVRCFVDLVRGICTAHRFDAPLTLTSLSERCFDCTLPLLFDRADASACARAEACWDALFERGREAGFLPYRMHVRNAASLAIEGSPYWRLVGQIKTALDPLDLLSPGRWPTDTPPVRSSRAGVATVLTDL